MTRTITSKAPGSGTSISSSWKASIGSPKRSSRMTQAAMVGGSSPGSTSTLATSLTSTATWHLLELVQSGADATGEAPPVAPPPEQDRDQDERRDQEAEHLVADDGALGLDVAHQVAEVLAEEA